MRTGTSLMRDRLGVTARSRLQYPISFLFYFCYLPLRAAAYPSRTGSYPAHSSNSPAISGAARPPTPFVPGVGPKLLTSPCWLSSPFRQSSAIRGVCPLAKVQPADLPPPWTHGRVQQY